MSSMNEYVEGVKGTMAGVTESVTNLIGQENIESMMGTMESVRESMSHLFSAETVEGVKETISDEAAIVAGYKDQLMGGVKETVGHLMGDESMEKEGHKPPRGGAAALAQYRAMGGGESGWTNRESEMNARYSIGRQEIISEVGRVGGLDRMRSRLNHVETRERPLSDFVGGSLKENWHLKTWDAKPLLNEISSGKWQLNKVGSPKEKGLMRSLSLSKEDFKLKESPRKRLFEDLNKEGALRTLHEVPSSEICDRSAPRLDLYSSSSSGDFNALLDEIKEGAALKHVETADKSKPVIDAEKPIQLSKLDKRQLLSEIKEGADLKHVDTEDKSTPAFDKSLHVKTWDRQGFLDEVRQGTELKHI
jgi:uncharacterized protein YjbJ (UPF0337 family)